jgi:hypothetical protein
MPKTLKKSRGTKTSESRGRTLKDKYLIGSRYLENKKDKTVSFNTLIHKYKIG